MLHRDVIPSPNYSSRGGSDVRLVVLHTAQGARTYQDLGAFFADPSSGVSSHVGIDDTPGVVGEYVHPEHKAWTAASANPVAVQAELCAFAEWSAAEWDAHPQMLSNTAAWVGEECRRFGLPIVAIDAAGVAAGLWGVCQHADLGAWGGGHWDCGPAFPMSRVIEAARGDWLGEPALPEEPAPAEGEPMAVTETVTYRFNELGCFQASNGQLWQKYSQDGGRTWRSRPLIRPSGGPVEARVKDTVSVSVVDGSVYVTTEDTDNVAWMCRLSDDVHQDWDIRRLP